MSDESYKPRVRTDVQYRELADGGVIYDTAAERVHTMNVTAAYVWNCCDGVHSVGDIASELQQQTKVSQETALKDVSDAITYFQNEGLLVVQ